MRTGHERELETQRRTGHLYIFVLVPLRADFLAVAVGIDCPDFGSNTLVRI